MRSLARSTGRRRAVRVKPSGIERTASGADARGSAVRAPHATVALRPACLAEVVGEAKRDLLCAASTWSNLPVSDPQSSRATDHVVGAHEVVRCLAVTASYEIDLAVTAGPFGFRREVVLKRVLSGLSPEENAHAAARLLCEAAALARLSHPAIIRLYELDEQDGSPVLVLEHVDGPSLANLVDALDACAAPLDDLCALYVGYRVFSALAAAHDARDPTTGGRSPVLHGDVAPGNVLVPWDGHVKLADFDLGAGAGEGTPGFAAPERLAGAGATIRSDVYSACALLRELLLRAAFAGPTTAPLAVVRPGLHPGLLDVLERGLATDPRQRTVTAADITARLRDVIDIESARQRLVHHLAAFVERRPSGGHPTAPRAGREREGTEPDALSSLRPTAVSVAPPPPSPPLAKLRTVKTARRKRRTAARVAGALTLVVAVAAGGAAWLVRRDGVRGAAAPSAAPPGAADALESDAPEPHAWPLPPSIELPPPPGGGGRRRGEDGAHRDRPVGW